jgi:hypothetical protein
MLLLWGAIQIEAREYYTEIVKEERDYEITLCGRCDAWAAGE